MPPPSPRRTPLRFIPVPDAGICADIDTPHDYAAAQNFLARTRECRDPTLEECWELLLHSGLLQSTRRHCVAVARGALRLGTAMIRAGKACTLTWHLYGGLLHDVTRQYTDHALRGRQLLRAWDWPDIADIVGAHTTLPPILLQALNIASCEQPPCRGYGVESPELQANAPPIFQRLPSPACQHACIAVYLADKFYSGDVQVTLEERFARIEKRFATDPPALAAIQCRKATAMAVSDWFFKLTGTEPGACVGDSHNPDPLEEHLTALSAVFENAPGSPQSRHHPYYHP